jgi:mRNA interferase MazF
MGRYISVENQINNIIADIRNKINKGNAYNTLSILQWTSDKIDLCQQEYIRMQKYKNTQGKTHKPRFVEKGWIYYAKLGKNIGSEQNGYRPVLVVQSEQGNITNNTVTVIPLTDYYNSHSLPKRVLGTHTVIDICEYPELKKKSIIKAEHITNISKSRLIDPICKLSNETSMKEIDEKIKLVLGIA